MRKLLAKIRKILRDRRTRRFLTRFVSGAAAIVVFVTTYALVLPAITMEKEANCGIEAHQHDDSCYTEELSCDIPESGGHHHDESCYSITSTLICGMDEHEHSVETGCYDEDGNLICEKKEHRHNDECYEETRELTCQIPESEGHQHTDECYEKVLTCGKEAHVHSTACFEYDFVSDSAVAASTSSASAAATSAGSVSSAGMTLSFVDETVRTAGTDEQAAMDQPVDNDRAIDNNGFIDNGGLGETDGSSEIGGLSETDRSSETASSGEGNTEVPMEMTYGSENAGTGSTDASNAALTNADNSATASTSSTDTNQYIPQMDAIDFNTVLNDRTGIYYHHVADGETVEDSHAIPAEDWNRIPNNTDNTDLMENMDGVELGGNDLLRVYLSYTIPAGSLNATNPVARYRLPSNLHLTDSQVKAINENVNGLAGQYVDLSTLEITDPDMYNAYLGVEAVEGTRRPDEAVEDYLAEQARKAGTDPDDAAEYISAAARVENVYDADGIYGEKDAYLGQDLIFTFAPYSIEKNQHEYDSKGQPTKAGQEIEGWLTLDLNLGQVDFGEAEITTSTVDLSEAEDVDGLIEDDLAEDGRTEDDRNEDEHTEDGRIEDDRNEGDHTEDNRTEDGRIEDEDASEGQTEDEHNANDNNAENSVEDKENNPAGESEEDTENPQNNTVTIERSERTAEIVFVEEGWDQKDNKIDQISTRVTVVEKTVIQPQDNDTDENAADTAAENTEEPGAGITEKSAAGSTEESVADKDADQLDKGDTDQGIMPAMSFTDSIRVSTGRPAGIDEEAEGTLGSAVRALPQEAEVSVRVEADEGTFPAGTTMVLKAVEDLDAVVEAVTETVENSDPSVSADGADHQSEQTEDSKNNNGTEEKKNLKTYGFQAVDITFLDKDGKEIQPAKPVRVAMTSEIAEQVKEEAKTGAVPDPVVVHVDDDGNAEQMELVTPEEIEPAQGKTEGELLEEDRTSNGEQEETETTDAAGEAPSVGFTADSFSVYAIVYTVDFWYNVNGQTYYCNFPGGGFLSFQKLVEALGIAGKENNGAVQEEDKGELTLDDVEVSDATLEFVADVASVEFSTPDLVWVGKTESKCTVGTLKKENNLEVQYSAELTEEQIERINETVIESGDWALISMQPFKSVETLTVTMKGGEVFRVRVTDAYNNPVTLHFVDEAGNPVTGITFDGEAISGSNFTLTSAWLTDHAAANGEIDLTQFIPLTGDFEGYTLSNTHKSNMSDLAKFNGNSYPHTIIGNELKWADSTLQYKLYYTNEDKAGWYWYDAGKEPPQNNVNWWHYEWVQEYSYNADLYMYTDPHERGDYVQTDDNDPNPYDYYLVYSPSNGESGSGSSSLSADDLDDIERSKSLRYNGDGTYTMDLSVTTHALPDDEPNGINLIVVFDTSSSMTRSTTAYTSHVVRGEEHRDYTKVGQTNANSRYAQTRGAMNDFLSNLYQKVDNKDDVQLALINFDLEAYNPQTFAGGSNWTSDYEAFMQKIDGLECHTGTNWADGLEKAMELDAPDNDNPTYVLLMTDGAPSQYWHEDYSYFVGGEACYLGAREEARKVVYDGRELYGIFSFGTDQDVQNDYLTKLVDYAYNGDADDHSMYAQTTGELRDALSSILKVLTAKIAHTAVNYEDGIALDTTSTALKVNNGGNLGSIVYSKTGGTTPSYTVIANRDGTIESFKVDGTEHKDDAAVANVEYNKITGGGDDPPNIEVTTAAADVYKCTYTEGEKTKTYIMPIATLDINEETQVGDLNWDLAPLGLLENGATYTISFVVWPDQEAYNYVADLNNGKKQWDRRFEIEVTDKNGKKYYKNGIFDSEDNPLYPNIVCYRDETTGEETFAVLTNTMQEVTYYIADEISGEETTYQYGETDPGTPPPMPLVHSKSKVEKRWSVDRDPGQLAQLLYDSAGNSKYFTIGFDVYQDVVPVTDPPTSGEDDPDTPPESDPSTGGEEDPETQPQPYTTFELGWIGDHETGQYVWDPDGQILTVTYGTATHEIGTSWNQEFSIAAGIMLSHSQMLERGLDTAAYPSGLFNGSSEPYYILEPGHDYRIVENTQLGYEFDKVNPVYHPMLVDGVLQNVNYEKLAGFDTPTADAHEIEITSMSSETGGIDALKITNTLRGYINLQKIVVDKDGKTELKDDNTKFTYQIDLTSPTNPGPFVDDHIPWYGVNGLFYHDDDFNYYQAVEDDPETNHLTLTTEAGKTYDAYCADPDSVFDDDIVGPTHIYYYTNPDDTATRVDIEHLFGNQMTCNDSSHVSATMEISRTEILNISNVPVETEYTIKEVQETGYDLISIVKEIRNGDNVETRTRVNDLSTGTITGTIVPDRDNHIIFTNKIHSVDITVKKFDENEMPMSGAVFTLTKAKSGDETEDTVYTLPGAGEADAAVYRFTDLPDGSYTLHETAPEGYAGIGDVTFTVADGMISSMGTLPAGVTWDNKTLTFTVVNTPTPGLLTVRKQWLDFFGNATNYNGTLDLTLTQWVPGDPPAHTVRFYLRCTGNGNGRMDFPSQITSIGDRSGTGIGDVSIQWDWNQYTDEQPFDVDGLKGSTYTSTWTKNPNRNDNKQGRQTLTIHNVTQDLIIYVTIRNNNYNGTNNSLIYSPVFSGHSTEVVDDVPTGGTKTVRLGVNGAWSQAFNVSGDGMLSDDSVSIPATYNGKQCSYTVAEESVPEGFTLQQISTDKIHSGALIAYNRRTTVDLVVEKVDENDDSIRLNGATFELRQLDPAKEGSMDMRSLDGGKTETKTTSGEGSNKGKLSFDSLGQGIYEIKETIAPDGYILESDSAFYIRVNESDVQMLQKDESKPASEWAAITGNKLLSLENATVTVGNTSGAALPNSGGPGTRVFTILGSILIAGAGLLLWRRRRTI